MTTSHHSTTPHQTHRSPARTVARWLISFVGFPLGGSAAMLLTGPVDSIPSALAGGFVTGIVLGAVQAWALRADRRLFIIWVVATAVGLAVGLAAGAALVGFATGLRDLLSGRGLRCSSSGWRRPSCCGRRTGRLALAWPAYLAGAWAAGWTVTTRSASGRGAVHRLRLPGALVATCSPRYSRSSCSATRSTERSPS